MMTMWLAYSSILCCFLVASGAPAIDETQVEPEIPGQPDTEYAQRAPTATETGNANSFVDMLLENVKRNGEIQLDPYSIPERGIGFNRSVLFIPVKGEMKIHQGVVTGLSTIHRSGDCNMVYEKDVMNVKVKLGMGVLKLKATGTIKFQGFGPSVEYTGEIGFADIDMALKVSMATMKPEVTSFKLNELKGMKATITGLGPLNFLFNFFAKVNNALFKNTFKFIAEIVMDNLVKKKIKEMKFQM